MQEKRRILILIGFMAVIVAGIGLYAYMANAGKYAATQPVLSRLDLEQMQLSNPQAVLSATGTPVALVSAAAPVSSSSEVARAVPADAKEYRSADYHFSILYPRSVTAAERIHASANDPLFVVFQDPATNQGFQIYAFPYANVTITQERFNMDEPSGVLQSPQNISVAGASGIMFLSHDPVIGTIREIWFIQKGILYEITTAQSLDAWMQSIMQTWQFI